MEEVPLQLRSSFNLWSYELSSRWFSAGGADGGAARVLLCGGLAGIVA